MSVKISSMNVSSSPIFHLPPTREKQWQVLSMQLPQVCPSLCLLCFTSPHYLHSDLQCWINISNTCSGLGSPCSKLQPSVDFKKKVQTPQHGIRKCPQPAPNISSSLTPPPQTYIHLKCQLITDVLVSSEPLMFLHLYFSSKPSLYQKTLLSVFKYA